MIYGRCLLALAMSGCFVAPTLARGGLGNGQGSRKGNTGATTSIAVASTASSVIASASTGTSNGGTGGTGTSNVDGGSANVLNPANVQTGSQANGQAASGSAAGQAPSQT